MSNRRSGAVTENLLPVTEVLLPRIGPKWGIWGHRAKTVQCTGIYELIDVSRVTEVTENTVNRELFSRSFKIIDIILVFTHFYKNLSIVGNICYFCYWGDFTPIGGAN